MGLKERRIQQNLTDNDIPWHQRNFKEFYGGDLQYEINWDEWLNDHDGILNLNGYVLQQITDTFVTIGSDETGKQALRDGLKVIKVVRVETPAEKKMELQDGTLTMHVSPKDGYAGVFSNSEVRPYLLDHL